MNYGNLPQQPNILILMTDQQRVVQWFPENWVNANLINLNQLKANGITMANGTTNTCRCSPVRGMTWTGLYPPRSGVTSISNDLTLNTSLNTIGKIMSPAYSGNFAFKGKWHLTEDFVDPSYQRPNDPSTMTGENNLMETDYGMNAWDAPDAGTALGWSSSSPSNDSSINTLGGGPNSPTQNDERITQDALNFLQGYVGSNQPFFLVTSLVNPHDVWAQMYSGLMAEAFPEFPAAMDALPYSNEFTIENLPYNYLGNNFAIKPDIQTQIRNNYTHTYANNNNISPVPTMLDATDALNYLKFYAYLNYLSDQKFQRIYTFLSDNNMLDNTIILRIADHGEMGMSQSGSMEKDCNFYRETVNVPIIFSNPVLWSGQNSSDALMGLVDLIPTLMSMAGVTPDLSQFQGLDYSQFLLDTTGTPPEDSLLYTYDDDYPYHIRAIQTAPGAISVEGDSSAYKYAVYYRYEQIQSSNGWQVNGSSAQFELYKVGGSDYETDNLLPVNGTPTAHSLALQQALHPMLTQLLFNVDQRGPGGPVQPTPPDNPTYQVGPAVTPYGWSNIVV